MVVGQLDRERTISKKVYSIEGSDGTQLYVEETGNPNGEPILFIHGYSHCGLVWQKQMNSGLVDDFRLITVAIRGHGRSEKPKDAYGDSQLWADDIDAVITTLELEQPLLSGWSYGGLILCDYLRSYGEDQIGGLHFVGATSKIGKPAIPFLGEDFVALIPGFNSNDVVVSQFGLMFFEDRQIALQEMFRVLKPQGRLVVTVFDSLDHIPGYERIIKVFSAVVGEEVAETLRFPFSFGDTDELKSLCSKSGITSAKVITRKEEARFSDVRAMVLADVNGWFPLAGITLDEKQIDEVVNRAEIELKEFIAPDRSMTFPMSAHFIVATKN